MKTKREMRQQGVHKWAREAFGVEHATNVAIRGLRHVEESIEVAQAAGVPKDKVLALVNYVYGRPPGELEQEIGGSGLTLLALCGALRVSADELEEREYNRVMAKPLEHFTKRNQAKIEAGFNVEVPDAKA